MTKVKPILKEIEIPAVRCNGEFRDFFGIKVLDGVFNQTEISLEEIVGAIHVHEGEEYVGRTFDWNKMVAVFTPIESTKFNNIE